jgi:hypothetical protein
MASDLFCPGVEQRCIIKFLVQEKVKPAEILCTSRINAQCGEVTLLHASVCHWCNKFPEGLKEVLYLLHIHVQPTAVCDVNILCIAKLILGKRLITVHDIAYNSGISVESVETLIHEHLLF